MALFLIDFENVHDSGISGITHLSAEDEVCIFYSQKSEHMSFDTHVNIMKAEAKVQYIKLRKSAKNYLDFQLVTHLGFIIGSKVPGPYFIISKDTGYDSVVDYWKEHDVTVIRQPSIGFNMRQNKQLIQQNQTAKQPAAIVASPEMLVEEVILPAPEDDCSAETLIETSDETLDEASDTVVVVIEATTEEAERIEIPDAEEVSMEAETPEVPAKPDTLPESFRKKVRSALKGKNIPSGNYSAIYKAIVGSYDKLALNNHMVKSFGSSKGGIVYNAIRDIFTEYHS